MLVGRTADKVKSRLRTLTNRAKKGILDPLAQYAQQTHATGVLHRHYQTHMSAQAAYTINAVQAQTSAQYTTNAKAAHAESRAGQLNAAMHKYEHHEYHHGQQHGQVDDNGAVGALDLDTNNLDLDTAQALDCLTEHMMVSDSPTKLRDDHDMSSLAESMQDSVMQPLEMPDSLNGLSPMSASPMMVSPVHSSQDTFMI